MSKILFGIDIGGTTIKCGVFDEHVSLIQKDELVTDKNDNGKNILRDIAAYITKTAKVYNCGAGDIYAGLAVPGSVMPDGVVNKCVNLGWGLVDVAKELSELLGIDSSQFAVINDANAAALGEYWNGCGAKYESILMITIGTGIGGGLIIDGKPVTGYNGAAAEIGHMPIADCIDYKCTCGKTGCLEQLASATGIARLAGKKDAKTVFDEAKTGDKAMLEIVDKVAMYLGKALAICSAVVDPQCFVIGGGVSAAGDILTDRIKYYYRLNVFHPGKDTPVIRAVLGNDAGMYGAVRNVFISEKE